MKKRVIFEVNDTLLTNDKKDEEEFFKVKFKDDSDKLLISMDEYLSRYEKIFAYYDYELLSSFLTMRTGLEITPKIIKEWVHLLAESKDNPEDQAVELLEFLKQQDNSLVVLSNWFGDSQIPRLKKSGLHSYFDEIYTGDVVMKPKHQAYITAMGHYKPQDCTVIGSCLDNDYIAPRANGLKSILYDKEDVHHKNIVKVKKLGEIKKIVK